MTELSSSDLAYCKSLVCHRGSVFSISSRFAHAAIRDELLILHAFLKELRSIPVEVSDPSIAAVKLSWWRQELVLSSAIKSQHPVVRSLFRSGVLERLDENVLNDLFSALLRLSSGEAIAGLKDLYQFAKWIGGSEALIEARLGSSNANQTALVSIGSAVFLSRLLQNFDSLMFADSWWVPLDIQAKFSLTMGEAQAGRADEEKYSAIRYLAGQAIKTLGKAKPQLKALDTRTSKNVGVHHVMISAAVIERRLNKLKARPESYANQGDGHVSEVISAWWQATQG